MEIRSPISASLIVVALFGMACNRTHPARMPENNRAAAAPESIGPRSKAAVADRVAEAQARLGKSAAGKLLWKTIEAHGGLRRWYEHGTITFSFHYEPLKSSPNPRPGIKTLNKVELWNTRAHQKRIDGTEAEFAWDGTDAWVWPTKDALPFPARFWALTPFYFVGIPFVLADPGTRYEKLPDLNLKGRLLHTLRVSYGDGVGDSPDDYYIIHISPETHRVVAIRYVVSYPGFFPKGRHSPEKFMFYRDHRESSGVRIARDLPTHAWDAEKQELGDQVTMVKVSDVRLGERFALDLFERKKGAATSPLK